MFVREREREKEKNIKQEEERRKWNQCTKDYMHFWIKMWRFPSGGERSRGEGSGADDGWVWGGPPGWSCDNELWVSEEEEFY